MTVLQRTRRHADGTLIRDRAYSYIFRFQGKQILRKTPYTTAAEARSAGLAHQDALQKGRWDIAKALRMRHDPASTAPTVEEYLQAYEHTPTGESTLKTRQDCARALRRVTADTGATTISLEHLTTAFRAAHRAAAHRIETAADQRAAITAKITSNTRLRSAFACFCRVHLLPGDISKRVPDLAPLKKIIREQLYFTLPGKLSQTREHPSPETLAATLDTWQTQPRDRFIMAGLALTFGLRLNEVMQVRASWIRTRDGHHYLDNRGDIAHVKDHTGQLAVRALDPFFTLFHSRMLRENWYGADSADPPLISTGRDRLVREISEWMISLGWKTKKKLHALRDLASTLVACRYDMLAARDYCRHASVTTTERHYTSLVSELRPADPTTMTIQGRPVEWARVSQTFIPQILHAHA